MNRIDPSAERRTRADRAGSRAHGVPNLGRVLADLVLRAWAGRDSLYGRWTRVRYPHRVVLEQNFGERGAAARTGCGARDYQPDRRASARAGQRHRRAREICARFSKELRHTVVGDRVLNGKTRHHFLGVGRAGTGSGRRSSVCPKGALFCGLRLPGRGGTWKAGPPAAKAGLAFIPGQNGSLRAGDGQNSVHEPVASTLASKERATHTASRRRWRGLLRGDRHPGAEAPMAGAPPGVVVGRVGKCPGNGRQRRE